MYEQAPNMGETSFEASELQADLAAVALETSVELDPTLATPRRKIDFNSVA